MATCSPFITQAERLSDIRQGEYFREAFLVNQWRKYIQVEPKTGKAENEKKGATQANSVDLN